MRGPAFFLLFLISLPLSAEIPFPLIPALVAAYSGGSFTRGSGFTPGVSGLAWQPDWPGDIPPDAFTVRGDAALIRLSGTSARYENPAKTEPETETQVPFEYRLRRDEQGRPLEFPLSLEGRFWQIRADHAPSGGVTALVFDAAGRGEGEAGVEIGTEAEQEPWTAEFPLSYIPFESPAPKLPGEAVRVSQGEAVYFVLFEEGVSSISESWYGPEGKLAGYFVSFFEEWEGRRRILSVLGFDGAERYHFESGASVSAIRGLRGNFSALYGARGQPLEREFVPVELELELDAALRPPEHFDFQWDERLLLVSMRDISSSQSSEPVEPPVEYRYEYTLDQRGNWLSRRETAYIRRGGLLIPAGTKQTDRYIVYRGEE
jgi:hypothetical protein